MAKTVDSLDAWTAHFCYFSCGGIHLRRVEMASPRHGDVSGFPRASDLYTLPFDLNPDDATGTQEIGI